MKLTKAIVLPVAAAVLVITGTGAVLAATSPSSAIVPAGAGAIVAAAASPSASPAPRAPYLTSVLDGLVAKGTITGTQEQAIVDAWVARRAELKAEREQLRSFLSDGVLTAGELAQLPADSPLQQLKPLMTNGQITVAQLRQLGRGILRELRAGLNGKGVLAPTASPATGG